MTYPLVLSPQPSASPTYPSVPSPQRSASLRGTQHPTLSQDSALSTPMAPWKALHLAFRAQSFLGGSAPSPSTQQHRAEKPQHPAASALRLRVRPSRAHRPRPPRSLPLLRPPRARDEPHSLRRRRRRESPPSPGPRGPSRPPVPVRDTGSPAGARWRERSWDSVLRVEELAGQRGAGTQRFYFMSLKFLG